MYLKRAKAKQPELDKKIQDNDTPVANRLQLFRRSELGNAITLVLQIAIYSGPRHFNSRPFLKSGSVFMKVSNYGLINGLLERNQISSAMKFLPER